MKSKRYSAPTLSVTFCCRERIVDDGGTLAACLEPCRPGETTVMKSGAVGSDESDPRAVQGARVPVSNLPLTIAWCLGFTLVVKLDGVVVEKGELAPMPALDRRTRARAIRLEDMFLHKRRWYVI